MANLTFIDKLFAGQSYEFSREKTRVGRGDQNDLVIRDASVSSRHCEILVNGYEVIVIDLASSNGTFINGTPLKGQAQLKSGQVLRLGSVEARLELDPPTDLNDASAITAVDALRHYRQREEREPKNPSPAQVALTPNSAESSGAAEQTILIPRATPVSPSAAKTPIPTEATCCAGRSKTIWIVLSALGVLAIVACWLWTRTKP